MTKTRDNLIDEKCSKCKYAKNKGINHIHAYGCDKYKELLSRLSHDEIERCK